MCVEDAHVCGGCTCVWMMHMYDTSGTFVVSQGKVGISCDRCSEGKVETMPAGWLVTVHRTDGLDHLGTQRTG